MFLQGVDVNMSAVCSQLVSSAKSKCFSFCLRHSAFNSDRSRRPQPEPPRAFVRRDENKCFAQGENIQLLLRRVKLRRNPGGLILQAANVGISSGSWTEPPSCLCRGCGGDAHRETRWINPQSGGGEVTVGHPLLSPFPLHFSGLISSCGTWTRSKACVSVCSDTSVLGGFKRKTSSPSQYLSLNLIKDTVAYAITHLASS